MQRCPFCDIANGSADAHRVLSRPEVVGFLDLRPVFKGHVLVIPRQHVQTLPELPDSALAPYFSAVRDIAAAVPEAYGAQGTFVAANNVVSQSVAHLHFHVVPRTKGDGLRGFFWPRQRYEGEEEMAEYAARLAALLD